MALSRSLAAGDWRSLLAAFVYLCTAFVVWLLPGVLGVSIASAFSLDHREQGLAVAMPLLGGSLLRIPLGLAADRFGCKRVGMICQLLVIFPLLWIWLRAESVLDIYAAGLLLGIAGASFAVALPLASRSYPAEHQGLVMGIAGAGNSGTALAALTAPALAGVFGWRCVFGLAVVPVLLSGLLYRQFALETTPQRTTERRYRDVLGRRELWWFNVFYGFTFGGFVGLASFLALFLKGQYGLDPAEAGRITAAGVILGSLARPVGGLLADRWGGLVVLVTVFATGGALVLAMSLLPPLPLAVATLLGLLLTLGIGNGAVFQVVPQCFRNDVGAATGIVGAAGGIAGFGLTYALGALREETGAYAAGFLCFALMALGCLAALALFSPLWRERRSGTVPAAMMEEQP